MPTSRSRTRRDARLLVLGGLVLLAINSCGRTLSSPVAPARQAQVYSGGGGGGGGGSGVIGDQVVVTLAQGVSPAVLAAAHGATLLDYEFDERTASFAPAQGQTAATLFTDLQADPRVVTSEVNSYLESAEARQQSFAFDDGAGTAKAYAEQPAAHAIRVDEAHTVALGSGVTVAILDTGIDPRHPALRYAYAGGYDFVGHDSDPTDVCDGLDNDGDGNVDESFGHGTHVAGIVHMVAPEARLLVLRVLDADGRGDVLQVAAGVRWAVDHGAKVINLSLGTLGSSDALQNALEYAENARVAVLSSAGNWGASTPVEFPARSSHVAAIAAVDASAAPAVFSSYGRIVALAAPGVAVRSTYPGGGYRLWSGTSMAAPFVTGTMALLAEMHPTWTLTDMLTRIDATARPVTSMASEFGAGALDAGAALAPDRRSHVDDPPPIEAMRGR